MLIKRSINVFITMFSLVLMLVVFSLPSTGIAGGEIVYLKYNVHAYQKGSGYNASYANWTNPGPGHVLFPVNTAVRVSSFSRWRAGEGVFSAQSLKIFVKANAIGFQLGVINHAPTNPREDKACLVPTYNG